MNRDASASKSVECLESESGQVLVEYSLVLALIVLVAVTLLGTIGDRVQSLLSSIAGGF